MPSLIAPDIVVTPLSQTRPVWGIVLAGTAPSRASGRASVGAPRGRDALRDAMARARRLVPSPRWLAVLTRGQVEAARDLLDVEHLVQPISRGSAAEAFLALLVIRRREPMATVVVLPPGCSVPADRDFMPAARRAVAAVAARPDLPFVLGAGPLRAPAWGFIETGDTLVGLEHLGVLGVRRFVRHPGRLRSEALGNTGVVIAAASTLLALGLRRVPDVLECLEPLQALSGPDEPLMRDAVYEGMPYADAAQVLFAADEPFGVVAVRRERAPVTQAASA